jgi:hypothetical protein
MLRFVEVRFPVNMADSHGPVFAGTVNLSAMDGGRFQAPPAVGQPLPPACAAELLKDGEIFDSDDDDDDDDDDDLPS